MVYPETLLDLDTDKSPGKHGIQILHRTACEFFKLDGKKNVHRYFMLCVLSQDNTLTDLLLDTPVPTAGSRSTFANYARNVAQKAFYKLSPAPW